MHGVIISFLLTEFLDISVSGKVEQQCSINVVLWQISMNVLGSVISTYANDTLGRRKSMLITNAILFISVASVTFSTAIGTCFLSVGNLE